MLQRRIWPQLDAELAVDTGSPFFLTGTKSLVLVWIHWCELLKSSDQCCVLATPSTWRKSIQTITGHVWWTMPTHARWFCWFSSSPTSESSLLSSHIFPQGLALTMGKCPEPSWADLPASTILVVFQGSPGEFVNGINQVLSLLHTKVGWHHTSVYFESKDGDNLSWDLFPLSMW